MHAQGERRGGEAWPSRVAMNPHENRTPGWDRGRAVQPLALDRGPPRPGGGRAGVAAGGGAGAERREPSGGPVQPGGWRPASGAQHSGPLPAEGALDIWGSGRARGHLAAPSWDVGQGLLQSFM